MSGIDGLTRPSRLRRSPAGAVVAAHQQEQTGTEISPRHGVERSVDGLAGEPDRIGHTSQCARNLCRAQALAQMLDHPDPERVADRQLARYARHPSQHTGPATGCHARYPPAIRLGPCPASSARGSQPLRRISRLMVERDRNRLTAIAEGLIPRVSCVSINARSCSSRCRYILPICNHLLFLEMLHLYLESAHPHLFGTRTSK